MICKEPRVPAMRLFAVLLVALTSVACGGSDTSQGEGNDEPEAESDAGTEPVSMDSGLSTDAGCADEDSDGVSVCAGDCNDNDAEMFPGNPAGDVCGDDKDNDCDGDADPMPQCCDDLDNDGVSVCNDDCDDSDAEVFPGNPDGDVCGDGKDNDCDGDADPPALCCFDVDDDGVTTCDDDCDDGDDTSFPGNPAGEVCGDGADNDCDGDADPDALCCLDGDEDGVTTCDDDCDDGDPGAYPGNPLGDLCGDGIDNDCDADPDPTAVCSPAGTAIGTYVSADVGTDPPTGTGLQNNPVRTIAQGQANAVTLTNGQPVFVAGGDYTEAVALIDGVDLLGGHDCDSVSCTWARDPDVYVSTIVNTTNAGVTAGDGVSTPTRLDGFVVQALSGNPGDGQFINAVSVNGGTPIISNCSIVGGAVTGGTSRGSRGVHVVGPPNDASGVLIESSELYAGDSSGASSAISLAFGGAGTDPAVVVASGNLIKGAGGNYTRAVDAWGAGAGTLFENNDIFAGSVVGSGSSFAMIISGTLTVNANRINHDPFQVGICPATSFWCGGIESEGATAIVTNNVVYGMIGPMSAAIYFGDGEVPFGDIVINANTLNGVGLFAAAGTSLSTALACRTSQGTNAVVGKIRNNILNGGQARNRFGMYEQDNTGDNTKTCEPVAYEHNDIFFRPVFGTTDNAHRQWLGGPASQNLLPTVDDVNLQAYSANNFSADCQVDPLGHLPPASMCIDKGTAAEAPDHDFEGDGRPQGAKIDVGADEVVP